MLRFLVAIALIGSSPILVAEEPRVVREDTEWCNIWVPQRASKLPHVLLVGDSITQAYSQPVSDLLKDRAVVARLTTSKSLGDPLFLAEVALVVDQGPFAVIHFNNGLHGWGYTEAEYEQAYPQLLELLKNRAPGAKLIWGSITPVRTTTDLNRYEDRHPRIVQRNEIAKRLVSQQQIPIDDLFALVENNPEYYSADGVHFNADGVKVQSQQVAEAIKAALK